MLENRRLNESERILLDIFLNQEVAQKNILINQLELADIKRFSSPYHILIKFIFKEKNIELLDVNYKYDTMIQIISENQPAPLCLILFAQNGYIQEFEVFNGDLSKINLKPITCGEITILM